MYLYFLSFHTFCYFISFVILYLFHIIPFVVMGFVVIGFVLFIRILVLRFITLNVLYIYFLWLYVFLNTYCHLIILLHSLEDLSRS